MADRSILYTIRAALQGGFVAVAREIRLLASYTGVLSGANNTETALQRIDGTGVGSAIFQFTGSYSAQNSNIDEWFGGRQLTRIRCSDSGLGPAITGSVTFDLPGTTALTTAFDQLVASGLPEIIRFVIEYTGPQKDFLRIRPRASGTGPQIAGTTVIIVRSGVAATIEITRTSGIISDYIFQEISQIAAPGSNTADSIKLQNPRNAIWDASASGILPSSDVVKGNAYQVFNAPADGSGRFGEVMTNNDWVVWEGETFTSWSAEPHLWFVMPAHEVRRITALEQDFLGDVGTSVVSDRNATVRGEDYAITAGEIRLKIYNSLADYSALDLNTTGDVDVFTDPSDVTGVLAIRLTGTQATLAGVLPTLYVYSESGGEFIRLFNLSRDFAYQGDFGAESDYVSIDTFDYTANDNIRVYVGTDVARYNIPNLDVRRENLTQDLQNQIGNQASWAPAASVLFTDAVIRNTGTSDRIEYADGYARGIDWRDMSESTTINPNRYLDDALSISVNLAAFTVTGFGNELQKLVAVRLQRNDANNGEGALIEIGNGEAFMRVNTSNEIQFNTTVGDGTPTWSSLSDGFGNVTIGAGGENAVIFEMVQTIPGDDSRWDLIAGVFNSTNYIECNIITFTPTGVSNGDNMGFSRSTNQRGQVTSFSAINSGGYLTHSALDTLLRQHLDDKWNLGYARLFQGSSAQGVAISHLLLESPNGTFFRISANDDGSLKTDEVPDA